MCSHDTSCVCTQTRLVAAGGHALLIVLGGLIVGVDDSVRGHAVGVVRLGPGVDGVDVIEHGHGEKSEHLMRKRVSRTELSTVNQNEGAVCICTAV